MSTDLGAMCVECARQGRPDARTRARYWSARQPTLVTYVLIGLNVAIFTLVPQVTLKKRLNLMSAGEAAQSRVPGLIVANWKGAN